MNSHMDSTKYRARSCDTLNITAQESQWNLQMYTPIIKQESVQHLDEDETISNDDMYPYKTEYSSDCVNYYDSKLHVLEEVKNEFPNDECPQPVHSISSRLVFENEESTKPMKALYIEQENQQEGLSSVIKDDVYDTKDQFILKMGKLVDHRILNHVVDPSKHCDVLVTPKEIKCQLCGRRFKNRFDLLQHDNVHIKTVPPIQIDSESTELYRCQYCDEYFNNYDNMLTHVCDVYSNKIAKSNLSQEDNEPYSAVKNGDEVKYKCVPCGSFYKSKRNLVLHVQRVHFDYGRQFECWCGKQFRSPIHLRQHKSKRHNVGNTKNDKFQCDICMSFFKTKDYLGKHKLSVHYDYGQTFNCWCGKQFRTPRHLYEHKYRQHGANVKKVKSTNNEVRKNKSNVTRDRNFSKIQPAILT